MCKIYITKQNVKRINILYLIFSITKTHFELQLNEVIKLYK